MLRVLQAGAAANIHVPILRRVAYLLEFLCVFVLQRPMVERRRTHQANRNPIRDAIAAHAYERFLARGCEHGHDLDDWLAAEREFRLRQATRGDRVDGTPERFAGAPAATFVASTL
jgi:hypothetical protein